MTQGELLERQNQALLFRGATRTKHNRSRKKKTRKDQELSLLKTKRALFRRQTQGMLTLSTESEAFQKLCKWAHLDSKKLPERIITNKRVLWGGFQTSSRMKFYRRHTISTKSLLLETCRVSAPRVTPRRRDEPIQISSIKVPLM